MAWCRRVTLPWGVSCVRKRGSASGIPGLVSVPGHWTGGQATVPGKWPLMCYDFSFLRFCFSCLKVDK